MKPETLTRTAPVWLSGLQPLSLLAELSLASLGAVGTDTIANHPLTK